MFSKHYVASPNGLPSEKSIIPSASVSISTLNAPGSVGNVCSAAIETILLLDIKLSSRIRVSNSVVSEAVPDSNKNASPTVSCAILSVQ